MSEESTDANNPTQLQHETTCKHQNQRGEGAMGTDGTGWSDTTCSDCGTRFVIGKPPQADGERNG